jgi:hypothetical protein
VTLDFSLLKTGKVIDDYVFEEDKPAHYDTIKKFVHDMQHWFDANPANVAAVQCSNGIVRKQVVKGD